MGIFHRIFKRFGDIKFRYKLITMYLVIGVIPMTFIGLYSYYQTREILMSREEGNLKDYLKQTALGLDNEIKIYNNLSDYITYNDQISKVITTEYKSTLEVFNQIKQVLNPIFTPMPYFHSGVNRVTLYTNNKALGNSAPITGPISSIKDEYWYDVVKELPYTEIEWCVDKYEKKVLSARQLPVVEDNPGTEAILYMDISYDNLFESFVQMSRANYGLYIVDKEGNVLFEHSSFDIDNNSWYLPYTKLMKEYQDNQNGNNKLYSIVSMGLESLDWTVWLYKPDALIKSDTWPIIYAILAITSLCVLASVAASIAISKAIVSSMEELSYNMKKVEKGNFDVKIESTSKDEVGDLIRGFNKMTSRINILIHEKYQSEISQREAEMKALQAQINPHFLYNSLSLINWRAIEADEEEISKITLLLSTFYRTALNKGNNILSIRDEIKNMQCYVDIQLMMHDYNFDIVTEVDEDIMEYATLNLILQPVVENAIHHGIDLKTDGRGLIKVTGVRENNDIIITVSDNGIGMTESKAKMILTNESKGYGVRNVDERIKLYYGEPYCITIDSTVGEGTIVTIRMPVKRM